MTRAITFTPGARSNADNQDLVYFEHGSRHRSIHALFQDCGPRSPSRSQFLLKAYREVVSRYLGFGKIEHPLPFLRELTRSLDALSKRLDCRVEDFTGIGVYILLQDGDVYYLLASREGNVALDWGAGSERLTSPGLEGVRELPLDVASAQKELFALSTRDHLGLYRIESRAKAIHKASGRGTALRVVMGGAAGEVDAVLETLSEPGGGRGDEAQATAALDGLSHKVVAVWFARAGTVRDPVGDALRAGRKPRRRMRVASATAAVLVVAALATVWVSWRLGGAPAGTSGEAADAGAAEVQATQDASQRLRARADTAEERVAELIPAPEPETPLREGTPVKMVVEWRKTYSEPVTTTPAIDGDNVIFGSRDGNVYALEQGSGALGWSYKAEEGVGASPVVAGGAVVGADYKGNVFCLDKSTGAQIWKHGLPDKVVSTPCAAGGEVLVGCTDGVGYGMSLETGRVLWKVKTGGRIRASAAAGEGNFYLPSYDGMLYAVSQGSGVRRWRQRVGGELSSTPAVDGGRVVVGGDGGVFAFDTATGRSLWRFRTQAPVRSFVSIEGNRVYAGCNDRHLYCLDAASGAVVWSAPTGEVVLSRPRVEDGLVFVTSYDKSVYCFDAATGEPIDRLETGGPIYSSPVVAGEHVFFGNNQGEFYCISYRGQSSR